VTYVYKQMADTNVVTAILLAKCLRRPVIVNSKRTSWAQEEVEIAATQVFGHRDPIFVRCGHSSSWSNIVKEITHDERYVKSKFIVLEHVDRTPRLIQALLLDMLLSRRLGIDHREFSLPDDTTVVIIANGHELFSHLRDFVLLEHWIDSASDVSRMDKETTVTPSQITSMAQRAQSVTIVPELKRYMQDIVIHLRTHRFVRKGVSARAVKDFDSVVRMLCVLQSYEFATPSIVQAAARKIFPLKIELCHPSDEPSLQYGGDIELLRWWMGRCDEDIIIDDMLRVIPAPV
jgi:hypothetical protein